MYEMKEHVEDVTATTVCPRNVTALKGTSTIRPRRYLNIARLTGSRAPSSCSMLCPPSLSIRGIVFFQNVLISRSSARPRGLNSLGRHHLPSEIWVISVGLRGSCVLLGCRWFQDIMMLNKSLSY